MNTEPTRSQWISILSLLGFLLVGHSALARPVDMPPWVWRQGYFRVTSTANYFSTRANYKGSRNSYEGLPFNQSFTATETMTKVRYNFTNDISTYLGAGYNQVNAKSINIERSRGAVTDTVAGADFYLAKGWMQLIAEMELSYAIDQIDKNTSQALIHDGVHYGRFSLFGYKYMKYFNPYVHVGVKIPDEGMAKLLLYGAALEMPFAKKFLLGAGIEGIETLVSDELSQVNRTTVTGRVNAGSYKYYTYNPALLEAKAWFGFSPTPRWQMRVGYGATVNGVHSAAGENIFFLLSFNFDPRPSREGFNYWVKDKQKRERTGKNFKVEPENEGQDLFADDMEGIEAEEAKALQDTERILEKKK